MNQLKLTKICIYLIICLWLTACGKKGDSSAPKSTLAADTAQFIKWPSNADIYLVGTITNPFPPNAPVATLWKNGVTTNLLSSLDNTNRSTPMGVAVNNNDVYVVGSASMGTYNVAVYWKNGVLARLTTGSSPSSANAITISGNDIYIAGIVDDKATVWKNGVATTIPTPSTAASEATSIYVNGTDVYLAGNIYNQLTPGSYMNAALWKNGQPINLDGIGGLYQSFTRGIYVKGNDVYVAGAIIGKGAVLWKNGTSTFLAQAGSTGSPDATAISGSGNDIYVTGYVDGRVTLWKNGVAQTLPYESNESIQPKILIGFNNSDVYLAAGYDGKSSTNALLWLNGTGYKFSNKLCQVTGMAIVTH